MRLGSDWTLLNDHRVWRNRETHAAVEFGPDAEIHGLGEIALTFGEAGAPPVAGNWLLTPGRGFVAAGNALREFFPLAADYQTPAELERWADAGINTVVRVRSATDPDAASPQEVAAWTAKASELGMRMIREPLENEGDDAGVLAWILKDEPDVQSVDPYDDLARTAKRVAWTKPVLLNFAGWSVLRQSEEIFNVAPKYGPGDRNPSDFYTRYVALADWVSQDIYAISQMYNQQHFSVDDALATLPLTFAKLRRWAPTKPQFAYVETNQQFLGGKPLSPAEFRVQLWLAIVGGMRGVFYFAAGGCHGMCPLVDATQDDVRAEMRVQNARIAALAHVLQGEINPLSFSISAPTPLETAWRANEDDHYIIAVNPTKDAVTPWIRIEGKLATGPIEVLDENRTIDTVAGYAFSDTFEPYATRVYRFR